MVLKTLEERFWSKVDVRGPTECWPWLAGQFPGGYGVFQARSPKTGKSNARKAHRVAYEIAHGGVPDGKYICHTCDNPPCVNPAHLYAGTALDNMRDQVVRGVRSVHNMWPKHRAKFLAAIERRKAERGYAGMRTRGLTEEQVRDIRRRVSSGETQADVARSTGITKLTINRIVNKKTWRHVA